MVDTLVVPSNLPYLERHFDNASSLSLSAKQSRLRVYIDRAASVCPAADRIIVLQKWRELLMINPDATAAGRQLIAEAGKDVDHNDAWQILQDHFARKSTSTLRTRVNSLCLFCKWFKIEFPNELAIPPSEEGVYSYLCHLRRVESPPMRGSTFMASLAFLSGFLGMIEAAQAAFSQRALGVAHLMCVNKAPLKRAPVLTVPMICAWELTAVYEAELCTRAFAGFATLLLLGRLRCSDGNRLECGSVEGDFLEGNLMKVKTAKTKEKQVTFLPAVIPTMGLLGLPWLSSFLSARAQLGLKSLPTERDRRAQSVATHKFVLFPSEASVSADRQSAISAADVSQRLREVLSKLLNYDEVQGYSSHSLKATMLSMFNKYGESDYLDEAQLLRYHVLQGRQSALNYTRDCLAKPMRVFMDMFECVAEGSYMPDNSRGRLFPEFADRVCAMTQFEEHAKKSVDQAIEVLTGEGFLRAARKPDAPESDQANKHGDVLDEGVSSKARPAVMPQVGGEVHSPSCTSSSSDSDSTESSVSSHEKGLQLSVSRA